MNNFRERVNRLWNHGHHYRATEIVDDTISSVAKGRADVPSFIDIATGLDHHYQYPATVIHTIQSEIKDFTDPQRDYVPLERQLRMSDGQDLEEAQYMLDSVKGKHHGRAYLYKFQGRTVEPISQYDLNMIITIHIDHLVRE